MLCVCYCRRDGRGEGADGDLRTRLIVLRLEAALLLGHARVAALGLARQVQREALGLGHQAHLVLLVVLRRLRLLRLFFYRLFLYRLLRLRLLAGSGVRGRDAGHRCLHGTLRHHAISLPHVQSVGRGPLLGAAEPAEVHRLFGALRAKKSEESARRLLRGSMRGAPGVVEGMRCGGRVSRLCSSLLRACCTLAAWRRAVTLW